MRLGLAFAAFLGASGQSAERMPIDGTVAFDGFLTLARGPVRDTARREFEAPAGGTFVAIIEEDDIDVRLKLERTRAGVPAGSIDVESRLMGEGIEVAVLDVARGDRLVLTLEAPREFDRPGRSPVKLLRYDASTLSKPAVLARVEALRAWSAATRFEMTADGIRATGFRDIDAALAHLQSRDGDPHLAAWARLVRANFSYSFNLVREQSLADARLATRAFARLGEARNTARGRYAEATALLEIAVDKKAVNPTPEDAKREGVAMFTALAADPALSPRERARSINNLGYSAFGGLVLAEAEGHYTRGLAAFRAIGDREGVRMSLANIGVVTSERGDLQSAVRSFDELYSQIDEIALPERRAVYLWNTAYVHLTIGNTDRAVERFLRMLQLAREFKMPTNEARALQGLAIAYWKRGDLTQAATFVDEGLKVRRQIADVSGVVGHLQSAGDIARDAGDIEKALALHREAYGLAVSNDSRMRQLTHVGLDHAAAENYEQAISSYRAALATPGENTYAFRVRNTELALADALLSYKARTAKDSKEASVLASRVLQGAIANADINMEQSARRVLANARVALGDLPEARKEYERAIALIFRYRATTASPEQQATVLVRNQDTFRDYVDLLMSDIAARGPGKLHHAGKSAEDALRVLESARVINFDAVRVARVDAATQTRIDRLLTQMADKRVRMATLYDRVTVPAAGIEAMQLDIAKLRAEIDLERMRNARGIRDVDWAQDLAQPWPQVAAGATQLSYALGKKFAYLWVRDATGLRVTVLARSPAIIERELDQLAVVTRSREPLEIERYLEGISNWLLPDGSIASSATSVAIVAEGKIASVPFAALRAPGARSRRLAESRSLVMISSMFESGGNPATAASRAARFVGMSSASVSRGSETRGTVFPALAAPESETRAIATLFERTVPASGVKLLSGEQGNSENVKSLWTGGADVFHFATHGLADLRQPLASLLMLPALDATGRPTYLTAGQVQEWRGDADLVYLSACETAVGPARFADGMPGLQRAFLRAGARGVIATLWAIEDLYARQFAAEFYRRYTQGVPAAQALSETQRAWMRDQPGISAREQSYRRMTAWAHAYYAR